MTSTIQPDDLGFFSVLAGSGSLSAAARELGLSTAAVSKHLSQMESRTGVALVNRTTRRMSLTPEGELYLARNPPPLSDDAFDVCIRFGEPPDARVIARRVAPNRRLLCAAPSYLAAHRAPKSAPDLAQHNCLGIRQGDDGYGVWRLTSGRGAAEKTETVRVRGNLTTNDGEIAVKWALDGHGVLMRAEWDIAEYVRSGQLVHVLPEYRTPGADIYAVYSQHLQMSARVRVFVDYLEDRAPSTI